MGPFIGIIESSSLDGECSLVAEHLLWHMKCGHDHKSNNHNKNFSLTSLGHRSRCHVANILSYLTYNP